MTSRYGITIPFDGVSLRAHRELFHRLADLGYSDVWSAEVDGADGFTPLVLAAAWESRLHLGVAVTPVFTRGPGLLAMSIAALAEVADGRFTMGLGASSAPVVQRWNGIAYEKPYARTRDVLRFVKRALDGEKIDHVYETFEVHGFKLSRPVIERPPILLGALRPGMLRLAGQEADGAILNWLGGGDALAPMWAAWEDGDRKLANEVIPDEVVDELIIHGSYDQCREHVLRYVEAGVQIPTIAIVPFGIDLHDAIEG